MAIEYSTEHIKSMLLIYFPCNSLDKFLSEMHSINFKIELMYLIKKY